MDPQLEFYRTQVGPGSYNLEQNNSPKNNPHSSFSKDPKLKLDLSPAPGIGTYNPNIESISKVSPRCIINKSPRNDNYWDKKMYNRSPGPKYNYPILSDLSPTGKHAVFFIMRFDF